MADEIPTGWVKDRDGKPLPPWNFRHPMHAAVKDGRGATADEVTVMLDEIRRLHGLERKVGNLIRAQDSFDRAVGELRDELRGDG